jgi:hypothetical protein
MKKKYNHLDLFTVVLITVVLGYFTWQHYQQFKSSCYSPEIESALKQAGDNRIELETVLNHYRDNPVDSLKYKAACFLIANMSIHYQIKGHEYFYYFMDSLNSSDLKTKEINAKCDYLT